ncbi:MAG: TetR/AcrR family transcriptional regulator [Nitrospirae bacterium]|nr:TetR/AcrR family transcriptional regulator [Nitrospirota bacterium]
MITRNKRSAKPEKHAARERLLIAALDIFTEKGYASTSVREIVEAARVTKPMLYYYFGNKEGIYMELMREPFKVLEKILVETAHEELSSRERVMQMYNRIFLLFLKNLKAARLMYSIYYGPPQGAPFIDFESYHLKIKEVTELIVKDGIRSGELRAVNADTLTWVLIGALNFVFEEQLCHRSPMIDKKGLAGMLDLIFDGVASIKSKRKR